MIACAAGANATTIAFNYTGSIVTYTVPATGVYDINAYGAEGGVNVGISGARGTGLGAQASGEFNLTAGETFKILVGGPGVETAAALTAGGSFVALTNTPVVGPRCSDNPRRFLDLFGQRVVNATQGNANQSGATHLQRDTR